MTNENPFAEKPLKEIEKEDNQKSFTILHPEVYLILPYRGGQIYRFG